MPRPFSLDYLDSLHPERRRRKVTPDERERMTTLCQRIATEQDREKFTQLVKALNDLLSVKDHRLEDKKKKND